MSERKRAAAVAPATPNVLCVRPTRRHPWTQPSLYSLVRIRSVLTLRALDRDYFTAELEVRGLRATARVSSYLSDGLGAFFKLRALGAAGRTVRGSSDA